MPTGRPTDLTPEVQAKILGFLRDGNYREVAAEASGISVRTLTRWCTRGRREEEGLYHDFWLAVMEAESEAEIKMVALVKAAAEKDADFAIWYLERKFIERWGRESHAVREMRKELKALTEQVKQMTGAEASV